ncbi:MAG TPA: hypothetical protein PLB81_07450 [Deltaproteobacteria bacterium]|nr:hypothetical protein [Deltaproteobacteria bacterium]
MEAIKRQFVQRVINGEIEISASDVVKICQEVRSIREVLGLVKKEEKLIDKEGLVKAFLAAIEAAEAPPDGE